MEFALCEALETWKFLKDDKYVANISMVKNGVDDLFPAHSDEFLKWFSLGSSSPSVWNTHKTTRHQTSYAITSHNNRNQIQFSFVNTNLICTCHHWKVDADAVAP